MSQMNQSTEAEICFNKYCIYAVKYHLFSIMSNLHTNSFRIDAGYYNVYTTRNMVSTKKNRSVVLCKLLCGI